MILKNKVLVLAAFLVFLNSGPVFAAKEKPQDSSDQQIMDFSLSGFGEKGKKAWDISGKSADIFTDIIKLNDVVGNFYGKDENIKLTANKGDFNKQSGSVHLEENVVITTSSGAKLTTNSLDWDRKNQLVSTKELVNIEKENMVTVAQGATGKTNLNTVTLQKDVQVDINPTQEELDAQGAGNKTVITCDGPLEINYEKNIAVFNNNVKVDSNGTLIYSDKMDVYFGGKPAQKDKKPSSEGISGMGSKIDRIVARGNVKIVRGENTSFSDEAIYTAADKKITLSGRPRLEIYSAEEMNAPSGD